MPLDIKKELSELQTMYKDNARTNSFNALIYGAMGTGKTNIAKTIVTGKQIGRAHV